MKGEVTFNSNGAYGMYSFLDSNAQLEINVESGTTLKSCGNTGFDIYGFVEPSSTLDFSGTGYTCDQIVFDGAGTVVEPVCQPCP